MTLDPKLNVVPFISVDHIMNLVIKVGIDTFLVELAVSPGPRTIQRPHGTISSISHGRWSGRAMRGELSRFLDQAERLVGGGRSRLPPSGGAMDPPAATL